MNLFSRSPHRDHRRHHHRRSPVSSRHRQSRSREQDTKDDIERLNPAPSKVLGVFGLSSYTEEKVIRRIFSKFGRINNIHIVYDRGVSFHLYTFIIHIENRIFSQTGRSRGFGFIYYDNLEDAQEVIVIF
jgi:transformer-2 protein